ncbi:multiple PDZ domain protein [Trichonephila clavipes]|nr:multiple PDZ domain protein [Trichonephila clavipes]
MENLVYANNKQFSSTNELEVNMGDHGLGIMILEGKHIELGRGIFISDIQKDSPAEKAGLGVGDMILAVNKTKLIGADYDLAASVLKNEDGPMTFLVVNSQKPASSPVHNDIGHDKKPRNSLGLLPENDTRRKSQGGLTDPPLVDPISNGGLPSVDSH